MPTRFSTSSSARVGLDGQRAVLDRRLQPLGVALDDDERHRLALELLRDDAADAAVAAEDEVIADGRRAYGRWRRCCSRFGKPPSTTTVASSVNV